jgi:hypothetical protein
MEGADLVDSVLDVVCQEAEGTDCLQGLSHFSLWCIVTDINAIQVSKSLTHLGEELVPTWVPS